MVEPTLVAPVEEEPLMDPEAELEPGRIKAGLGTVKIGCPIPAFPADGAADARAEVLGPLDGGE